MLTTHIIGGGIIGLATALKLLQSKLTNVTILDRHHTLQGGSGEAGEVDRLGSRSDAGGTQGPETVGSSVRPHVGEPNGFGRTAYVARTKT